MAVVPIIELEWSGTETIGRLHGTTMLAGIVGQTLFFNGLHNGSENNLVSLGTAFWIQFSVC